MKDHHITILFAFLSVIFWAAAMVGCSIVLKGDKAYLQTQCVLGFAAAIHFIFIWGPMGFRSAKKQKHAKGPGITP